MTTTFSPSPEQSAFFDALRNSQDNLMLKASAGSGKTTTIEKGCRILPLGVTVRFLAFNKNIQEELARRLPPTVTVTTFHSCGNTALRRAWPKARLDQDKSKSILKRRLSPREFGQLLSPVSRLVSHAKAFGLGTDLCPASHDDFAHLIDHFNLDCGDAEESRVIDVAQKLLETSVTDQSAFDFDDMLYLPLRLNLSFDRTNYVFIDEAQDTNCVQRALLHRLVALPPWGRVIAVGDPSQAIYGFRGADADAMDALQREFQMQVLPLSVSYRCSKAVVKEAQKYC